MTTVTVTNFTLLDPRLLVIERNTQLGGSLQATKQWPTLLSDPDYVIATFQAANENVLTPFAILDEARLQRQINSIAGGGGGSSLTITDGTTTIEDVAQITVIILTGRK